MLRSDAGIYYAFRPWSSPETGLLTLARFSTHKHNASQATH